MQIFFGGRLNILDWLDTSECSRGYVVLLNTTFFMIAYCILHDRILYSLIFFYKATNFESVIRQDDNNFVKIKLRSIS